MTEPSSEPLPIFAYGTLQRPDIQQQHFGRLLEGTPDELAGYALVPERITDTAVIAALGIRHYWTLVCTGDQSDEVAGLLYWLSPAELAAADAYEEPEYRRFRVVLKSGCTAWVWAKP